MLKGTVHVQSGLKMWKSSTPDLVGTGKSDDTQRFSIPPYLHSLEVVNSGQCIRGKLLFSHV